MKERSLVIGGIVSLVIAVVTAVLIVAIADLKGKDKKEIAVENNTVATQNTISKQEEPLIVALENKVEEAQEEITATKDAATLTQEVYDINGAIGILNIPKTGLNTQIYSKPTADSMEIGPCFLYTTGGINQVGTTVLVGHNRENGLLFSNNNMLEENDEFYFTDLNGVEKKYIVYSKFVTASDDVSFYNTEVDSPVIAMQCCLTANIDDQVIIIMGKAEN